MPQFGAGSDLVGQCPPPSPPPSGYRPWVEGMDGAVPADLAQRAQAIAADNTIALGSTASYPLPGVTVLIRAEAQIWNRDTGGNLVQGCYRVGALYVPDPGTADAEAISPPADPDAGLNKAATVLTVVTLVIGIGASIVSWARK